MTGPTSATQSAATDTSLSSYTARPDQELPVESSGEAGIKSLQPERVTSASSGSQRSVTKLSGSPLSVKAGGDDPNEVLRKGCWETRLALQGAAATQWSADDNNKERMDACCVSASHLMIQFAPVSFFQRDFRRTKEKNEIKK